MVAVWLTGIENDVTTPVPPFWNMVSDPLMFTTIVPPPEGPFVRVMTVEAGKSIGFVPPE
jgi:hypothetical protein